MLGGCASAHDPTDPLEPMNRKIYSFNDALDRAVVKPVAQGYVKVMPTAGQIVVSNFFSNLNDVTVTINDLLQFKLKQGFSDGMRFFVNTTIGALGLIDIASINGLEKHKQDFGQTLAKWGVGNGPYLILPILGPSTARDGVGWGIDTFEYPIKFNVPTRNEMFVAWGIDKRASLLSAGSIVDAASIDPYSFTRDTYLLYRKGLINGPQKVNYDNE